MKPQPPTSSAPKDRKPLHLFTEKPSTGVHTSGELICAAAHEVGAVTIADCVTSLGTMPINLDATGIDVAYSCTQKGLSCPPGLSPISCSPLAMERLKARTTVNHSWYLDLKLLAEYYEGAHRYHHTAPITMFYALREGLNLVLEEGVEARYARHKANPRKARGWAGRPRHGNAGEAG